MSEPVKYMLWVFRNPWAWPGLFKFGCWWEKRYRPERWRWKEGAILLRYTDYPNNQQERRP